MIRTEIKRLDDVTPAHLRPAVGAALAARLQVSLWTVRDLPVVHVNDGGSDGWRIFMPIERDSDALEVFTRISRRMAAILTMGNVGVRCEFGLLSGTHTAYPHDYRNDMGAALRGAITNAAVQLYKHEQASHLA